MRTVIPGGVDAGAFSPHAPGSREYLAMERGTLVLTIDSTPYTLRAGDSIYYAGDSVHAFANPAGEPCVYYLAMEVAGTSGGTHRRRCPRTRHATDPGRPDARPPHRRRP
jgi:mannose-6-phosphate isomerase-like protein (cupin superfamily)